MGISYQTRNRLRRKVATAPLSPVAPPRRSRAALEAPAREAAPSVAWPWIAALGVALTALVCLYLPS